MKRTDKPDVYEIVTDFKDSSVSKKSDRPIWEGFRIWPSVNWPIQTNYEYGKYRRIVNTVGCPSFDIFSDWLMDFATISANGMDTSEWQNFRRLVLVHVPKCTFRCWYCFNDAWKGKKYKCETSYVSARRILNKFKNQQSRDKNITGDKCNVLRLTGGEPFINPNLIADLADSIREQRLNLFFWVDTNLFPIARKLTDSKIIKAINSLKSLGKKAAVHACFHLIKDGRSNEITGVNNLKTRELLNAYKWLINNNLNVYPRINPLALTADEAEEFFLNLYDIDNMSPAKIYLGIVELGYDPSRLRMKKIADNNKRDNPNLIPTSQVIYWWNKMLQLTYGVGYGVIPRHLTKSMSPIMERGKAPTSEQLKRRFKKQYEDKPDMTFIFMSKGSYRESYALKTLEALALPEDMRMNLEIEKKYVEPNLLEHSRVFSKGYENKDVLIVTSHHQSRGTFHITPVRWGKILTIDASATAVNIGIKVKDYPSKFFNKSLLNNDVSGEAIYELFCNYNGQRNLPIDGYYCQLMALPGRFSETAVNGNGSSSGMESTAKTTSSEAFLNIVKCLNNVYSDAIKKDVYYRISKIIPTYGGKEESVTIENGELCFKPGQEIEIVLETFNKNLDKAGYPKEMDARVRIHTTEEEDRIKIITPKKINLSKFGKPTIRLRIRHKYEQLHGEIIISPLSENARIPEIRLPFKTIVEEVD